MENTMINRFIPLIILLVAGCETATHTTTFILDTNPQGATVICDDRDADYSPMEYGGDTNANIFGSNRAITEKDIAKITELTKIKRGELKVGENKALADKDAIREMRWVEATKIVHGELKFGENVVLTDKEVVVFTEAKKIIDGELDFGEYTASIDAEERQEAIQFIQAIKDDDKRFRCTAYWSSGVSKEYPSAPAFRYFGNGYFTYILQRPDGDGYTQDAEFALKIKRLQQQEKQNALNSQNARLNALIAHRAVQSQERAARAQEYQNNKPITCHTSFGTTTCY